MVRGILLNVFMVVVLVVMVGTILLGVVSAVLMVCNLIALGGY